MDREAWLTYSPWGRKESDTTEQLSTHNIWTTIMNSISTKTQKLSSGACFFFFFSFYCFYLFIFWLYWEAYGISVPKQGSNLYLLHWKWRVLTAGPPEVPKACLCQSLRTIGVLKGLPWESKYLFKSLRSSLHHEAVIYSVSLCIRDFAKFWKYRYKREKKKKPYPQSAGWKGKYLHFNS